MFYSTLSAASSSISICLSVIGRLFSYLAGGLSLEFWAVDRRELRNSWIVEAAILVITGKILHWIPAFSCLYRGFSALITCLYLVIFLFVTVRGGWISNIGIDPSSAPQKCLPSLRSGWIISREAKVFGPHPNFMAISILGALQLIQEEILCL